MTYSDIVTAARSGHASISVAQVLADRSLGSWYYVAAGTVDSSSRYKLPDRQNESARQAEWTGLSVEG